MVSKAIFQGLVVTGLTLASGFLLGARPAYAHPPIVVDYVVDDPPPDIERSPHTHYADRDVYWARGHWYYRHGPRWYYYRHEPAPLYRHRVTTIEHPRYGYHHRPERRIVREREVREREVR